MQELNISHTLREEIIHKVKDDEVEAVFDEAQQEVSINILVLVTISWYREVSPGWFVNIQYIYVVNIYLKGVQYTEPQFMGEVQGVWDVPVVVCQACRSLWAEAPVI